MLCTRLGARFEHCFPTVGCGVDARVLVWRVLATIFTVAIWLPTKATLADNLVLVTHEEFLAERQARIEEPPLTRAFPLPGAPKIHVLQPVISGKKPLHNPILIELTFSSASDADIDPASFRAYYGFLRIDLTERILNSVRVEKSGLKIENAEIPTGKHRLFLFIADTKERAAETEVRFVVE